MVGVTNNLNDVLFTGGLEIEIFSDRKHGEESL